MYTLHNIKYNAHHCETKKFLIDLLKNENFTYIPPIHCFTVFTGMKKKKYFGTLSKISRVYRITIREWKVTSCFKEYILLAVRRMHIKLQYNITAVLLRVIITAYHKGI